MLVATPIDLTKVLNIDNPNMRITYRLEEHGSELEKAVKKVVGVTGFEPATSTSRR